MLVSIEMVGSAHPTGLGLDLPEPEALLERLLAVSLPEASDEPRWDVIQYQGVGASRNIYTQGKAEASPMHQGYAGAPPPDLSPSLSRVSSGRYTAAS